MGKAFTDNFSSTSAMRVNVLIHQPKANKGAQHHLDACASLAAAVPRPAEAQSSGTFSALHFSKEANHKEISTVSLPIHRFHICGFNQSQNKNIWGKKWMVE